MKKCFYFSHIIVVSVLFLLFASCTDRYIDVKSPGKIEESDFWSKGEKSVDLALVGCYNGWEGWYNIVGGDVSSDNAYGQYSNGYGIGLLANGTMTPSVSTVEWIDANSGDWFSYSRVRKYNTFLKNIQLIDMDATKKAQYVAEVRFLRAYDYFNKVIRYGGVPLVTTIEGIDVQTMLARNTEQEIQDFIFIELNDIIKANVLPEKNVAEANGHVTIGAVYALKARYSLYLKKWQDAQDAAKKVIDMKCYSLFQGGYDKLFEIEGAENKEAILSVQYIPNLYKNYPALINSPNSGNGWAATQVSWDLIKAYEKIDATAFDPDDPFLNKDPRLKMTILYPGAPYKTPLTVKDVTFNYFDPFDNNSPDKAGTPINQVTYMLQKKYTVPSVKEQYNEGIDIMVFRLAEMYLIYVEASLYTGQDQQGALDYLNKIRSRTSVGMPNTTLTEANVRRERRIELALEGLRYFDIKRWDIGATALNGSLEGVMTGIKIKVDQTNGSVNWAVGEIRSTAEKRVFKPERKYLFPIPQKEIDINPNMKQNEGY